MRGIPDEVVGKSEDWFAWPQFSARHGTLRAAAALTDWILRLQDRALLQGGHGGDSVSSKGTPPSSVQLTRPQLRDELNIVGVTPHCQSASHTY
jgi:hypothetical protein